jgi:signal transduction histidine kinase
MEWLRSATWSQSAGHSRWRTWIVAVLAIVATGMTACAHRFLGSGILVTHVLYLPAVLAALWWGWRGLGVGLAMAVVVVASHLTFLGAGGLVVEGGRAVMIAGISALIALLSERIAQRDQALRLTTRRLEDAARELALAEDRQRREFAAALHDQLGQDLIAAKLGVGLLREEVAPDQRNRLEEALGLIDQAVQRVRTLTFDICPPVLYQQGLGSALEWLCDSFQERTGITTHLEQVRPVPPMDDEILGLVFRSVRELLQNVFQHAQAGAARVLVDQGAGQLRISVEDDGIGFITDEVLSTNSMAKGFGLFSIRQHLQYLGGRLEVESSPGDGARCAIFLPLAGDS